MATNSVPQNLLYGVSLSQFEELHKLLRHTNAISDPIADEGRAAEIEPHNMAALGMMLFDMTCRAEAILKQIGEQDVSGAAMVGVGGAR